MRVPLMGGLVLLALLGATPVASASVVEPNQLAVRIDELDLGPDGTSHMTVSISGLAPGEAIDLGQLEVVENGAPIDGVRLASVEEAARTVAAVVVAVDVSGSTEGAALSAAQEASIGLVRSLGQGGALVGALSFGPTVEVIAPLATSAAETTSGIRKLTARGGTALFDAVARGVRMLSTHDGPRDLVVFSDGEDTTSASSLDDVRGLLADSGVRVTSVVLDTDGVDTAALQAIADASGGTMIRVEAADELASAFDVIAADLTNRVQITWSVEAIPAQPPTLNVVATYRTQSGAASDGLSVTNPRLAEITPPVSVSPPSPPVAALSNSAGLVIGVATTALAVLLLAGVILSASGNRRRQTGIQRRMASYAAPSASGNERPAVAPAGTSLTDRAATLFESLPSPSSFDEKIAADIEHADWPMRVGEFTMLVAGATLGGAVVLGVLGSSVIMAGLGAVLGAAAPFAALNVAISRRRAAFAEQLPTVLQVLSGALRAGHAFSTAVEGAVGEVDEPARSELRRASVESRLGRPMEQALLGVADRMDSIDLRWVVSALSVQRQVGGNLAEVLNNVAATLRARASVKRTVSALSAEGRLSAWVIGAMPFVLFAMLSVQNPDYVSVLFTDPIGRLLLGTGVVLLIVGIIWLRRVIRPQF